MAVQGPPLQALPIPPCLHEGHGGLSEYDGMAHQRVCPVSAELPEFLQRQDNDTTETLSEASGAYGIQNRSHTAPCESTSALEEQPPINTFFLRKHPDSERRWLYYHLKMNRILFLFGSVILVIADGFIVHGPSGPLFAPLGSSVVLPCYVTEPFLMEDLEVQWRRTDSYAVVHLFLDGESRPEVKQQDYHDRAHFFTDQIQHGNFSLHLDNLTAEDEGRYTCRVYSQQDSGETFVEIKAVFESGALDDRLLVSGSDKSISASVGEDVTLNCSVDSHIKSEHIEVSWRKTDEDIPVLFFQNHKTFPDSSHERYRDRVELFPAEIPKGNFSLRLKSVRTEDKGVYMCHVKNGRLSANTTVIIERLSFSALHIVVLVLCITGSGSALLPCVLVYASPDRGRSIFSYESSQS
ncbi:butyrophilin-like protein 2 [Carassius gibelio]|uniref:butyrophilin-like protein 2 n=1 Tax=Carassius gibelio TaxID=101364 RepID=UPI002277E16B|nr:butyrophilin-like protein 2 [Carassius gibelio]